MMTKKTLLSLFKTAHQWLDIDREKNPDTPNVVYSSAHKALEAMERTLEFRLIDPSEM